MKLILAALVAAIAPIAAHGADRTIALLPATAGDVVAQGELAKAVAAPAGLDRAPVEFAWALDADAALVASRPYVAESVEYWTNVDAKALARGVAIRTTAPGAVVRLSPAGDATKSLDPLNVTIRAGGITYARGDAFANASNGAELKAAGAAFPEGTVAFKLKPEIGAGTIELVVPKATGAFLLHVFEPDSAERLTLTTDRATLVAGDEITVSVDYASAQEKALGRVGGLVTAPNGDVTELAFAKAANGRWTATARPDVAGGAGAGLWEVHAFATTRDGVVQRDAKTAFNAAPATARFTGTATRLDAKANAGGVAIGVGVAVAAASRYNVSGVLYATDRAGRLVPAAIAHSATWLGAGSSSLVLRFGADLVAARGFRAPYELRDLTLSNQGNLGVMEQRARALRLPD